MQGDFDRVTFNPDAAFAGVLLQQGRLLLPSDFNEQGAILQHYLRQLVIDLKGPSWQVGVGFDIAIEPGAALNFTIAAGHFYVDGVLCENPEKCEYANQPHRRTPAPLSDLGTDDAIVYLDCFERHVSWLQEPALRDAALGGIDTATRLQIVWQVRADAKRLLEQLETIAKALTARQKVADANWKSHITKRLKAVADARALFTSGLTPKNSPEVLAALRAAQPLMIADAKEDPNPEPCAISPDAEYRGRENQLYRVEIHEAGTSEHATFKWSRENGSVAFRVLDVVTDADEARVTLESLGHDRRSGVCEGDWVELSDDDIELGARTTPLLRVSKVDVQRRVVTLEGAAVAPDPGRHAILRRWDHKPTDTAKGAVHVEEAKDDTHWIELERGIRIRFITGGYYEKGHYWLIAARAATGDIDWPSIDGKPKALRPHGVIHHYATLGVVSKSGANWTLKP